jgi:hypothetical protein
MCGLLAKAKALLRGWLIAEMVCLSLNTRPKSLQGYCRSKKGRGNISEPPKTGSPKLPKLGTGNCRCLFEELVLSLKNDDRFCFRKLDVLKSIGFRQYLRSSPLGKR